MKNSVCIGLVFFAIALVYMVTRDEPFTIWESAVRYWPMTVFGLVYAVINTISFNGYIHNEATVESPVEGISGGTSTILLIIVYLALGRVSSISKHAVFALGFWIYIWWKERKPYNPFTKHSAPRILGAIADNVGIVFYSYAMAMNSVSTDPLLALYPIFVMKKGDRLICTCSLRNSRL
ncbi:hypothetical protein [Butyrivibrio fibrisolvens]|uniref:Uncharacterized protein n=1 Tax=Butyrivibrio fibrisolvens TaxID=831 RepID=A0A317FX40_BUTFI|nr:hypothetical protein [Butyrivibrio fibrisolvens]PWT25807.1 hypothetical protein CPT75_00010 [Butyrivibrio fibrisolvens]